MIFELFKILQIGLAGHPIIMRSLSSESFNSVYGRLVEPVFAKWLLIFSTCTKRRDIPNRLDFILCPFPKIYVRSLLPENVVNGIWCFFAFKTILRLCHTIESGCFTYRWYWALSVFIHFCVVLYSTMILP